MKNISRRKFLYLLSSISFYISLPGISASARSNNLGNKILFSITIDVLKAAYAAEKTASENYAAYSRRAIQEQYPNIAYLFTAFAASEDVHAKNYQKIINSLNAGIERAEFEIILSDTKSNLIKAAEGELAKIKITYPDFLARLEKESHEQAVKNCRYAWKSHQQHKQKIDEIRKYSKLFFSHVAQKIEGIKFDFHVCEICGSTIDEVPTTPCDICRFPMFHYHRVNRPV